MCHFFRNIVRVSDVLIFDGRLFRRYAAATEKAEMLLWILEFLVGQAL